MFQKILVAIDSSEIGQHIFEEAVSLAKMTHSQLMLLHVLSPFDGGYISPVFFPPNGFYPNLQAEAVNNFMKQWEEVKVEKLNMLRSLNDKSVQASITTEFSLNLGDPGQVICEIARSWHADLIMVGRRGRQGLSELFLGSVSNYVMHHAPCSVLTVQRPVPVETEASPTAPATTS